MSARVSVRSDGRDDEVVAVKVATTPEEVEALVREAAQLGRASHPGVVSLVEHRTMDDGAELLTRFAGEPLDRWRGSLARLAGLGAAVAATLADLHEMGIVHGRVDGSHVLVGRDGRPRLCGFSPHDGAQPADDVAALGGLLRALAEQAPVNERRGLLAWRRGPHAERRGFEQVLAHAEDPVPTRRPSARALATALLTAVTDAELPPAGEEQPPIPTRRERPPAAASPDRPALPRRRPLPGDLGDAPAPEPSLDRSPSPLPPAPAAATPPGPRLRPPRRPRPAADGPARRALPPGDADAPLAPVADGDVPTPTTPAEAAPLDPAAVGGDRHGRARPGSETRRSASRRTAGEVGDEVEEGVRLLVPDDDPDADGEYDDVFGDQTHLGFDDLFNDRPWADDTGPGSTARPLRPRRRTGTRRGGRLLSQAAVLIAAAVGLTALLVWLDPYSHGDTADERSVAAPDPSATDLDPSACPSLDQPDEGGGDRGTATAAEVDVDGDGCPDAVHVEGGVVEVAGQRWAIGQADDRVAFGDWDCDGIATPAVYRPATGDVFVFPAWAESGQPLTIEPVTQIQGGRSLTAVPADGLGGGCDAPVVELATGARQTVEVTP